MAVTVAEQSGPGHRLHILSWLDRPSVAARIAAASGCSLRASNAAATSNTWSRLLPLVVATSMTVGWLAVRGAGLV